MIPVKHNRIESNDATLMIIDIQDKLFRIVDPSFTDKLTANVRILIEAARVLKMPITVTEQYSKGLGRTIPEISESVSDIPVFDKLFFDCMKDDAIRKRIQSLEKRTVILCGIETHICVMFTAISLLSEYYTVVVVSDAVGSRHFHNWEMGLAAMRDAGALIYPTESVCFMLMEKSGTDSFKKLSPLFK